MCVIIIIVKHGSVQKGISFYIFFYELRMNKHCVMKQKSTVSKNKAKKYDPTKHTSLIKTQFVLKWFFVKLSQNNMTLFRG